MSQGNAVARALVGGRPVAPGSQATHIEQSRAVAEVQAMVVVAQRSPRDEAKALSLVIETCKQLPVAERAFFKFPRGGQTVSGESIHMAREVARCWGNIVHGLREMSRDDGAGMSEMLAYAWDLQTNTRSETTFIVPHKRDKSGGPVALTDLRDIYENNANNGARRLREMIFNVVPPWLIEEAKVACHATLERQASDEPLPKKIATLIGLFAAIGVSRERIESKAGLAMDKMTPPDLAALGVSLRSIRRNEITAEEEFPHVAGATVSAALKADAPAAQPANEAKAPAPKSFERIQIPLTGDGESDWKKWAQLATSAIQSAPNVEWLDGWAEMHAAALQNFAKEDRKPAEQLNTMIGNKRAALAQG